MANAWLECFLSELHRESLKPAGFRKEGSTFSRDHHGFVERFNFQGSSWSSSAETLFYLNVGVEFPEFGPAQRNWVYFKRTHWAARIDELVKGAPDEWRCGEETDRVALKAQLAKLVLKASDKIVARLPKLRAACKARVAPQTSKVSRRTGPHP